MAAGAVGLTVGTLGEAEVFAAGGLALFLAHPLRLGPGPPGWPSGAPATPAPARRFVRSAERSQGRSGGGQTMCPAWRSSSRSTAAAHGVAPDRGRRGRGGRRPPSGCDVVGVVHPSAVTATPGAAPASRPTTRSASLATAAEVMARAGGSSRGSSVPVHADGRRFGEWRRDRGAAGTYVFGDTPASCPRGRRAGRGRGGRGATVVSVDRSRAGSSSTPGAKILGKDVASYVAGHGEPRLWRGSVVRRLSTTTAWWRTWAAAAHARGRATATVVPNHICPVVNLVDTFVVSDGVSSTAGRSTPGVGTARSATSSTPTSARIARTRSTGMAPARSTPAKPSPVQSTTVEAGPPCAGPPSRTSSIGVAELLEDVGHRPPRQPGDVGRGDRQRAPLPRASARGAPWSGARSRWSRRRR